MPDRRSLLDRRLLIVTGKGGTGKTTVVAALALAAHERGLRVGVIETGRESQIPGQFGHTLPDPGYAGCALPEGPWTRRMEPYAALAEYLRLQLRIPGLVTRLLDQPAFHALLDAAPGWRELITLGKVWHLEQARERDGSPSWDLLIIDAPATGHGLTFLDVPRVVVGAVRAGPLNRQVGLVEGMIRDPEHTLLLPVTLPEELPVRETLELVARARDEVGIALDRVVVNACVEDRWPLPPATLAGHLEALPGAALEGRALAHAVTMLGSRSTRQSEALAHLSQSTPLPLVRLPQLVGPPIGSEALRTLGRALVTEEPAR